MVNYSKTTYERLERSSGGGSRISQGVSIRGPLGGLFSRLMGPKIAQSFAPLLEGLKARAERES